MQVLKLKYYPFLIIFLILSGILLTGMHKFYVSLTEIKVNEAAGTLEISIRMFPDDLDKAVMAVSGINPQFVSELEHEDADAWLEAYLSEHFILEVNEKSVKLEYLGKEAESDAVWCYLEVKYKEPVKLISLSNTLLVDSFEEQKNIVQVYSGEFNKGLLMDAHHSNGQVALQ